MKTNRKSMTAAAVAALALSGCGGWFGNDDDDPAAAPVTEVVDSAGASTAAFVTYLQALTADETSEPLTIRGSFTTPADETSEPTPLT